MIRKLVVSDIQIIGRSVEVAVPVNRNARYVFACIWIGYDRSRPVWKLSPLVIHDHDFDVTKTSIGHTGTKILAHKGRLSLSCPSHTVESETWDVPINRFVLCRNTPKSDAILCVLFKESFNI